jgi:hypothetical protein
VKQIDYEKYGLDVSFEIVCDHAPAFNPIAQTIVREIADIAAVNRDKANMRLIAAAPDLLAALRLLWNEVVNSGNANARDHGWPIASKAAIAAIALAEGR